MNITRHKGFIFDLNGTMIDDMHFHLKVWTSVLNENLGASMTEEQVRINMYGTNHELLERVFGKGRFSREEADTIGKMKEDRYQAIYKAHMKLISGLPSFIDRASASGIALAIGSAAIPYNIDFVLDNLSIRHFFPVIVSAEDVVLSKPHPEVFLKAAAQLSLAPHDCLVFEDAPKGVEAARNAGMKCIAIKTMHEEEEFHVRDNIICFIRDYTDPVLEGLFD